MMRSGERGEIRGWRERREEDKSRGREVKKERGRIKTNGVYEDACLRRGGGGCSCTELYVFKPKGTGWLMKVKMLLSFFFLSLSFTQSALATFCPLQICFDSRQN